MVFGIESTGTSRALVPGGEGSRPVNPMPFREGTSCFSLKWDNDWLGA